VVCGGDDVVFMVDMGWCKMKNGRDYPLMAAKEHHSGLSVPI